MMAKKITSAAGEENLFILPPRASRKFKSFILPPRASQTFKFFILPPRASPEHRFRNNPRVHEFRMNKAWFMIFVGQHRPRSRVANPPRPYRGKWRPRKKADSMNKFINEQATFFHLVGGVLPEGYHRLNHASSIQTFILPPRASQTFKFLI